MRRGKILPALVLFFLAFGFLLPRPGPDLSLPAGEARIAGQAGDGEMIIAPQPPAVFVPFPVLSTSPSAFFLPGSGRISAVPDHIPLFWSTRTGAEVMKSLVTPVLGGMVSSLLHVLVVTPVIFLWLRERELDETH